LFLKECGKEEEGNRTLPQKGRGDKNYFIQPTDAVGKKKKKFVSQNPVQRKLAPNFRMKNFKRTLVTNRGGRWEYVF